MVKMTFLLNNKPVDALALIVHRTHEQEVGRQWVKKLRKSALDLSPPHTPSRSVAERATQTRLSLGSYSRCLSKRQWDGASSRVKRSRPCARTSRRGCTVVSSVHPLRLDTPILFVMRGTNVVVLR